MIGVFAVTVILVTSIAWYFDMKHLNKIDDMGMDD